MIVIKLLGKSYDPSELEANSKIVRKWYVIKQVQKTEIIGKYHVIKNCNQVCEDYN